MFTCDDYQGLLWDELYGLLDASQSESLRRHLDSCSACQNAMKKAEAGQRLLAGVARLNLDIPLFRIPAVEPVGAEEASVSALLPLRRPARRRRWIYAAAAAVLVFCLGVSCFYYERGLAERSLAVVRANKEVESAVALEENLFKQKEDELNARQAAGRAQYTHLQVLGPAIYRPGVVSPYHILATDLNGAPRQVELTARLTDTNSKRVVFEKVLAGKGELTVSLPAELQMPARTKASLEIIARDAADSMHFLQDVSVLEARYITHLTTDKTVYHPGETIYFQSLTLEPSTLKPADRTFNVSYALLAPPSNVRIKNLIGPTRADGVGGGAFALDAKAVPGVYTLMVTQAGENRFDPVRRTIFVEATDAAKTKAVRSASSLQVDFFPEGGILVAGLPNRVYFRARTAEDAPAEIQGTIVDSSGHEVAAAKTVSAGDQSSGVGMFTLTPARGESYQLRIASSGLGREFALPQAQSEGVALRTPTSVAKEGDSLPIFLGVAGHERELIIAVSCRGSLVAEEAVTAKPGITEVKLKPAAGTHGVLRVTVVEPQNKILRPVAERLLYCIPSERLDLAIKADKNAYRPGERVTLTLRSEDKKRQPEQSWLLVSTGKRDALSQASGWLQPGLPLSMQFSTPLNPPEAIEEAYFEVKDEAEAKNMLDLFLATEGWRRISPPAHLAADSIAGDKDSTAIAMFAIDNIGQVERRYLEDVKKEVDKARAAQASLREDADKARLAAATANRDLSDYQERTLVTARLAIGACAVVMLVTGTSFLVAGIIGLVRGSLKTRRRLVAGALVPLVLCALAFPLSNWLGRGHGDANRIEIARSADRDVPLVGEHALKDARQSDFAMTQDTTARFLNIGRLSPGSARIRPKPADPLRGSLPLQEYVFDAARQPANGKAPDTLLWKPVLPLSGQAQVSFDLPKAAGAYRVRVEGHSASGRLGIAELVIEARANAK